MIVNAGLRLDVDRIHMVAHSMGSFIGETFAMHYGGRLNGLLLSGSSWPQRLQLLPGRLLAKLESWRLGKRGHSALIDALGFSAFNRRFRPVRTEMDWLSRDENEVDKYIADPLCGGPFTCGCGSTSSAACSNSDLTMRSTGFQPTCPFSSRVAAPIPSAAKQA